MTIVHRIMLYCLLMGKLGYELAGSDKLGVCAVRILCQEQLVVVYHEVEQETFLWCSVAKTCMKLSIQSILA